MMKTKISQKTFEFLKNEFQSERIESSSFYFDLGYNEFFENIFGETMILYNMYYDYRDKSSELDISFLLEDARSSTNYNLKYILNQKDKDQYVEGVKQADAKCLEILIFIYGTNSNKPAA